MAGFFQNLLKDAAGTFFGSEYLRDYTHASKIFRTNNYENSPRLKFLFHTYFDINPDAYPSAKDMNFGLAVKTVKLPSFNIQTQEFNQYNRKRIVQTKIKYDPITITFHDDSGNMIRNLWKAYYYYHYFDGNNPDIPYYGYPPTSYNRRTQYQPSIVGDENWGYIGEPVSGSVKIPFFRNIAVFGFQQHKAAIYILVNPVITRFSHDTYNYNEGSGTMELSMDIEYETVVYREANINGESPDANAPGFGTAQYYDKMLSPIARPGSNANITGQGGLVDAAGGLIDSLAKGNILNAVKIAGTTYNTFKGKNLASIVKTEALTGLQNVLNNTPNTNRNVPFSIPSYGQTPSTAGTNATVQQGIQSPTSPGATPTAGSQLNNWT